MTEPGTPAHLTRERKATEPTEMSKEGPPRSKTMFPVADTRDPGSRTARPQAQTGVGYLRHLLHAPGFGAVAEGAT